ncbi:hypothetical protein ALC62_10764 [Cyphomyrmex costatus]|uniref:Tudor domain-containing protein n=1 Tax=Cyphomyrmex costatus TaxID=456900 RepID=A0A151IDI2_9HYME|nr:hypothetical protein ALC62_10764 [Cyphomyrmex costatus]
MEIQAINTRQLSRGPLNIKIIKVISPTYFWVHLNPTRRYLEELLEDLTRRMTRKGRLLRHNPDHVIPNELVAVCEGRMWQRGIVVQRERGNMVTVALRDWGRIIRRPISDMHLLEDQFRELRWQAIPYGLAHICPVGLRTRWPRRSRELTRLLLERREGWMRILVSITDKAAVVTLELKRESEDEMSSLKDLLISMGCAQHIDEKIMSTLPGII